MAAHIALLDDLRKKKDGREKNLKQTRTRGRVHIEDAIVLYIDRIAFFFLEIRRERKKDRSLMKESQFSLGAIIEKIDIVII